MTVSGSSELLGCLLPRRCCTIQTLLFWNQSSFWLSCAWSPGNAGRYKKQLSKLMCLYNICWLWCLMTLLGKEKRDKHFIGAILLVRNCKTQTLRVCPRPWLKAVGELGTECLPLFSLGKTAWVHGGHKPKTVMCHEAKLLFRHTSGLMLSVLPSLYRSKGALCWVTYTSWMLCVTARIGAFVYISHLEIIYFL